VKRALLVGLALLGFLTWWHLEASASPGVFIQPKRPPAATAASGTFDLESKSANNISSGSVTSASMSFTCTANTKLLLVGIGYRRNGGQNPTITYAGSNLTQLDFAGGSMAAGLYFLRNPTSGSNNVVVTMSASVPGLAVAALSFTGVTTDPDSSAAGTAGSVTTSTQTRNTSSGDFLVGVLVKQDPTTSNPTKNTAGDTLQHDFTFSSLGNGGYFKMTTSTATGATTDTNFSWTTAANRAHAAGVVNP
jgi:hypothetical protein